MRTLMTAAGVILATWALAAAPVLAHTEEPLAAVALKAEAQSQAQSEAKATTRTGCRGTAGKAGRCASKARKGGSKARVATPMISQCRDVISHQLARCGGPNAEPVPAN